MPLRPLDVIRIRDEDIKPPGPKMVVCICPDLGLFYSINSYEDYPIAVPLPREPDHLFLRWDSFLECGSSPIALDDALVEGALQGFGGKPWGQVSGKHAAEIMAAVDAQKTITKLIKRQIRAALEEVEVAAAPTSSPPSSQTSGSKP